MAIAEARDCMGCLGLCPRRAMRRRYFFDGGASVCFGSVAAERRTADIGGDVGGSGGGGGVGSHLNHMWAKNHL